MPYSGMKVQNFPYLLLIKRQTFGGSSYVSKDTCFIHISSYDDLNGSDWNHGKFGGGNTTRIH